jgi:teichuronic acid biosynthesis glycosyltransferase TuaG
LNSSQLPLVSIIMPCFNGASTLRQAVDSVISQTLTDWELIIVDDGSTDGSMTLLSQYYGSDKRIRVFVNTSRSGASGARNHGLQRARGRFIAFLDSDDFWLAHKLDIQVTGMRRNGAGLLCSAYDVIDAQGKVIGDVTPKPGTLTYRSMLRYNSVGCLTAIIDRECTGDVRFSDDLARGEDYQLWLSLLRRGVVAICQREKLAVYRLHGKTLSSNKLSAARSRWRVYREFEKYGVLTSMSLFLMYGITGIWKNLSIRRKRYVWF